MRQQRIILVVEDDLHMQRALRDRLSKDGYKMFAAVSVDEGLAVLKKESVDLVLLDLRLGDKSGLDFMDEMRDDDHIDDAGILVVVLTSIADPAMMGDVIGRGSVDYLVKADNSLDDVSAYISEKFGQN